MTEKIQASMATFMRIGEVIFKEQEWSEEFESQFKEQLKNHGVQQVQVYRSATGPACYVVCRMLQKPSIAVEQRYPQRSLFKTLLPLGLIILPYFLLLALYAQSSQQMVSRAFLIFLPLSLGAIIEYVFALNAPQPLRKTLLRPVWTVLGVLLVGLVVLHEGVICLIMMAPIFLIFLMMGAVFVRQIYIRLWKPSRKLYSIALLPLLMMVLLPNLSQYQYGVTEKELIINAPIETVFLSINNIQHIKTSEIKASPIFIMGFPKPISGMTEKNQDQWVRQIYWQRGIHFQEKITKSESPTALSWTYQFTPESFPKGSLDDHLEMGGRYFNLLTTDYRLEQISAQQTKLILTIDYRLSTEINWYSNLWVRYVLNEFSDVVLHIYKNRLEQ